MTTLPRLALLALLGAGCQQIDDRAASAHGVSSGIVEPGATRIIGVAVLSGVGGWSGMIVSLGLDPRDLTAANGWGNAMRDLPARTQPGGTLFVFALP